eukprot:14032434-Heterocapsa_arctica.AAC.1
MQSISAPTFQDTITANEIVRDLKETAHLGLTFWPIALSDGDLCVWTDASWANADANRSQAGFIIGFVDKKMMDNKR